MQKAIGKVAKIINETILIVTYLHQIAPQKPEKGDNVIVATPVTDIINPDSNKKVGTYYFNKVTLQVTEVWDTYFVCSKVERKATSKFDMEKVLFSIIQEYKTEYQKLNVNQEENENIDLPQTTISIGDTVLLEEKNN